MSYPYYVQGTVTHGFGRGSKELGCPTANLDQKTVYKVNIPTGVYWGLAQLVHDRGENRPLHDEIRPMICSIGFNPHYGNQTKSLEVHILHKYDHDFYDSTIKVAICGRIRDELSFPSLQALIDAIESDKEFAQHAIKSTDMRQIKLNFADEQTFQE